MGEPERAKVIVEVTAGLVPGQPDPEFTKRWAIPSQKWHAAGSDQFPLLAEVNGRAIGYAAFLMLQPYRLNWVRTDWIWL